MAYYLKSMSSERVQAMGSEERLWWMKRLAKEKRRERPSLADL